MSNLTGLRSSRRLVVLAWVLLSGTVLSAGPSAARGDDFVAVTPPRLSLVEGQVSFWPAGGSEWEAAPLNLPLAAGDYVSTGEASRIELEIGSRAFLRAASHVELGLEAHDESVLRVLVNAGRATVDVRGLDPGSRIEVRTPHATLTVTASGLFDVRADPERSRFSAYEGSGARVDGTGGTLVLTAGFEIVTGSGFVQPARYDAPISDDWIHWNRERSDRILAAASRRYVPEGVYGVRDLDDHGTWREAPSYGRVWVPARVPATWAPYTTGRWVWHAGYGWSWVDTQPWGWAPFHYGRWVWLDSYWAWAPGPVAVRPVYAPALVAFLSPPVGIVVGASPYVSWVALGWGEPVLPWWGPTWYRGRPCWRGWGGPTYINEVHVHVDRHGRYDRRYKIDRYRNQRIPDAVVGVHRRDFDRRSAPRVRFDRDQQHRFRPHGDGLPPSGRRIGRAEDRGRWQPTRPAPERVARRESGPGQRGRDFRAPGAGTSERFGGRSDPRLQPDGNRDRDRGRRDLDGRRMADTRGDRPAWSVPARDPRRGDDRPRSESPRAAASVRPGGERGGDVRGAQRPGADRPAAPRRQERGTPEQARPRAADPRRESVDGARPRSTAPFRERRSSEPRQRGLDRSRQSGVDVPRQADAHGQRPRGSERMRPSGAERMRPSGLEAGRRPQASTPRQVAPSSARQPAVAARQQRSVEVARPRSQDQVSSGGVAPQRPRASVQPRAEAQQRNWGQRPSAPRQEHRSMRSGGGAASMRSSGSRGEARQAR